MGHYFLDTQYLIPVFASLSCSLNLSFYKSPSLVGGRGGEGKILDKEICVTRTLPPPPASEDKKRENRERKKYVKEVKEGKNKALPL